MSEFKLRPLERDSDVWKRIREHLETRLETMRRKNDGDLGPEDTAKVRGRIAELKYLLGLDKPAPTQGTED